MSSAATLKKDGGGKSDFEETLDKASLLGRREFKCLRANHRTFHRTKEPLQRALSLTPPQVALVY